MKSQALTLVTLGVLGLAACSSGSSLEKNMDAVGLDPDEVGDTSVAVDANKDDLCARPINANYLSFVADRPDLNSKLLMVAIARTECPEAAQLIVEQVALADDRAAARLEEAGWR